MAFHKDEGCMKSRFGDKKYFKSCYGAPPVGNYALEVEPPKSPHWYHCREQFATKFGTDTVGFFFSHPSGKGEGVAEFVVKFETILGLDALSKPFDYSSFALTTKDNILWTQPSDFWKDCYIKRSLLTMILRCGMNYDPAQDNFDDALFGEQYKETLYVRETRPALLRFMFGFTKYTGQTPTAGSYTSVIKHGWREEFMKMDEATIRRRLVLPEGETREPSIIGLESLWC
jgi:hypothetical protein